MVKLRKVSFIMLLILLLPILSGCKKESTASDVEVLRIGTTTERGGNFVTGLEYFAEKVKEYSNGKVEIQIYPSSQLGNERDLVESISLGSIDMALVSTAVLSNISEEFKIFDMPYIIRDLETAYNFMDGESGRYIMDSLLKADIKGLGLWENGFRHITNNGDQIVSPSDVKGIKIRTMENEIHQRTFQNLGATATAMAWGEVFTSLQQGVIDGQENPLAIVETNSLWEAQDNLSLTQHFYSPGLIMINDGLFESFDKEIQEAILKAEKEARDFEREFNQNMEKDIVEHLKEEGMNVYEVDLEEWIDSVKPIYEYYHDKLNQEYVKELTGAK